MLGDKLCELDSGSCHTDTGLGLRTGQTTARVLVRLGRRDNDGIVADELNAVFVDGDLLGISARCNNNLISARSFVDGALNALAILDVDGVALLVVVFLGVVPVVAWVFRVLVFATALVTVLATRAVVTVFPC